MDIATWPKEVTEISGDLLRDGVQINIGSNKSITQVILMVVFLFVSYWMLAFWSWTWELH
jgi:hypothetical protein